MAGSQRDRKRAAQFALRDMNAQAQHLIRCILAHLENILLTAAISAPLACGGTIVQILPIPRSCAPSGFTRKVGGRNVLLALPAMSVRIRPLLRLSVPEGPTAQGHQPLVYRALLVTSAPAAQPTLRHQDRNVL